jgi:Protein of unknown function (DUF2867)
MVNEIRHEREVPPPSETRIADLFAGADLVDAYAIHLPPDSSRDIETLARFMFGHPALWFRILLALRDAMVAGFGIKTAAGLRKASSGDIAGRIYMFRIIAIGTDEMILGEDDMHLDFRASVLLRSNAAGSDGRTEIVVTTVARCHNRLGRIYLAVIAPFHRIVVRSILKRASRKGWPAAAVQPS